ncbi:hypothetical protein BV20DRAFT_778360 [Pilatotrama ljubarskyi]|nr:hypothetical protein BV20DRAFT_778360 [Pilatotrama ljubarskyi]
MGTTQPDPAFLLKELHATLEAAPPFCSGTLKLSPDMLDFYYGKHNHQYINFAESAQRPADIEQLEAACDAAAFGRNEETVIDETYRKAGKMDLSNFVMRFDAERSRLVDVVRTGLLTGDKETRGVVAEPYKLNVYGKGAFFKPHVDTPHAANMFASLVVVFPTPHEGGELVLRQEDRVWTFDSSTLLTGSTSSIAYIAFFSDVEHEVLPVLSGHRITITYNLYVSADGPRTLIPDGLTILQPPHASPAAVSDALRAFVSNPEVLPRGGTLGFGLRHVYPLPRTWNDEDDDPLEIVGRSLKGSDAALYHACEELGLNPRLRLITEVGGDYDVRIMLSQMAPFPDYEVESRTRVIMGSSGAHLYKDMDFVFSSEDVGDEGDSNGKGVQKNEGTDESGLDRYEKRYGQKHPIHWVTKCKPGNNPVTAQPFVSYGNQAMLSYLYVSVRLIADVAVLEKRGFAVGGTGGEKDSYGGGRERVA